MSANANAKQLLDLVKEYGRAARDAFKNGDIAKAEEMDAKMIDALKRLYELLGYE